MELELLCAFLHIFSPPTSIDTVLHCLLLGLHANSSKYCNSWNCDFMVYLNVLSSAERLKKVSNKNPQRVGANFDRKKETGDDW